MIELKDVSVQYVKNFCTIYNLNTNIVGNTLFVGDEFLGTVTLFRLLSKIEKPTSGEILFDGKNLCEIKDKDLNLAYITKQPYLFEHRSVFYNLYYPLKLRKIDKKEAKNSINALIFAFLSDFPKKIRQMSASQKKILTLLRALVRKPKIILLEHFFEDLDEDLKSVANKIIHEIEKKSQVIACEKTINDVYKDYCIIEMKN